MIWKTLFGKCIYTSPSGFKVYQNFFYRWLTLGSTALQTMINRHHPEKPVLHYISILTLMARTFPGDSCLLGLGGASVPQTLKNQRPKHSITAVDNNDEVIQIAKKFFMVDSLSDLTIIHKNAADYVQEVSITFDHLMIDLYDANNFPIECNNDAFFSQAKKRLNKDGFIAVNLANYKEQWPIFQLIKKQFKNTLVIPIKKSANMVIIASSNESNDMFINHIRTTGELKKISWMESWGYVGEY